MASKDLSNKQKVFLASIHEEKPVARTYLNPTGKSLATKGLVRYVSMWGWCLTPAGIEEAKKHLELLDEN